MSQEILQVKNLFFRFEREWVIKEISFELKKGEMLGIIGPNGSGKSTLIRLLSGVLEPEQGEIIIKNQPIQKYSSRRLAQIIAVVPQQSEIAFPFTVQEVVMMGRAPYLKRFQWEGEKDYQVVERAMALTETAHLSHRSIDQLSGGERQRVILARALAQEPEILLADEPTTYLDLHHQIRFMNLLWELKSKNGLSVIFTTHDLNLASFFSDRVLLLNQGELAGAGGVEQVLKPELVSRVYQVELFSVKVEAFSSPLLFPRLRQKNE